MQARPADRRPDATSTTAGSSSSRARPGRSAARPMRADTPARHPARRLPGRQPRFHRAVRARRAARRCKASSGAPAGWCCRSSTTCGRCSRCSRRRRRLGAARRWPACRRSAWSTSGRSTSKTRRANGDLLANVQDPLTPSSLMLLEPARRRRVLKRAPPAFSADGPGGDAARSGLDRRRAHPLCPDRPGRRDRRRAGAS